MMFASSDVRSACLSIAPSRSNRQLGWSVVLKDCSSTLHALDYQTSADDDVFPITKARQMAAAKDSFKA